MSQSRSLRTDADAALRRVPDADRRDPWRRPDRIDGVPRLDEVRISRRRYGVRWAQRTVAALSSSQTRINVPLIGPAPPPNFGYRLSQRLVKALNSDPIASRLGPVTVAANVSVAGASHHLTMVITTRPHEHGRQFDTALMSSPLELALRVLSNEDDTFRAHEAPRSNGNGAAR